MKHYIKCFLNDVLEKKRYGAWAPSKYETIWIKPSDVNHKILIKSKFNGVHPQDSYKCILDSDWDLNIVFNKEKSIKYKGIHERIFDGKDWNQTDLWKDRIRVLKRKGSADGCKSLDELTLRYNKLDNLVENIRLNGTIFERKKINKFEYKESQGVPILIGRDGKLVAGIGGTHRLILCQILNVKIIPASLVAIHPDALTEQLISQLRVNPSK
ncbi:MAG: hypothetical protein LAT67_04150 [Balneolales bacterium]|nr:hypothetical protein [Balneolales bacterium]